MLAANFSLVRMVSVIGVAASGARAFTMMFLDGEFARKRFGEADDALPWPPSS